jgi:hypothetical protein
MIVTLLDFWIGIGETLRIPAFLGMSESGTVAAFAPVDYNRESGSALA